MVEIILENNVYINMYDLSILPNKVTYCNWRTRMVFNGTENYKFSRNHNIVNFISIRPAFQSPWVTAKCRSCRGDVCCSVVFDTLVGVFSVLWSEMLMTSAITCPV